MHYLWLRKWLLLYLFLRFWLSTFIPKARVAKLSSWLHCLLGKYHFFFFNQEATHICMNLCSGLEVS